MVWEQDCEPGCMVLCGEILITSLHFCWVNYFSAQSVIQRDSEE